MPKKSTDGMAACSTYVKTLIHYLCNLEYTGRRYRGTRSQFVAEIAAYIERYKRPPVEIVIPPKRRTYTQEEDGMILRSKCLSQTARTLGRTEESVCSRRKLLRRRAI